VIAPRWRKVARDTLGRPWRSLLAVLALSAGVFQVGAMLFKYSLLQPELTTMYGRTHPASATFSLDRISDALVDSVRHLPGIAEAEARPVVLARVRVGDAEWVPGFFQVIRDFDALRIDTFTPEDGAWPPRGDQILLERTALQVAKAGIDDRITLRTPGDDDRTVHVAGTVHAPGLPPAWMEHMVSGFVPWDSPLRASESAQLRIVVADHPLDEGHVREVADSVRAALERMGHTVGRVEVPVPGRHPHADQMEAFLFLLLAFGILSFALSTVLVAGMAHTVMAEQLREIGIMKAIGATDRQITGLFLGHVSLLAAAALVIGIPAGIAVGRAYATFAAGILNADISHQAIPGWLIAAVAVVGMIVPLLVALAPVRRASRITVLEALSDEGIPPPLAKPRLDRWLEGSGLPRPLALSLRTTFARRPRLILTIGAMAVAGAVFMAALNVSAAWRRAVNSDFAARRFDIAVSIAAPVPVDSLDRLFASVSAVERAEYWPGGNGFLVNAEGVAGAPASLLGWDPGSDLLDFPLLEGRRLTAEDGNVALVNRAVMVRDPVVAVGDSVRIRLRGRTVGFAVVGVVNELNPHPTVYAVPAAVRAATGQVPGLSRSARIVTRDHTAAGQLAAARELERVFERAGLEVTGLQRMQDARQGILDHLVIIIAILTMASVIVVFVAALGLTSTLTLNVIQRTREIGILGAIGATPGVLSRQVWIEAMVIGILGWIAANLLTVPVSWALETAAGTIFFKVPLPFHLSPAASAAWLVLVLVLASASSLYPAHRAARLTVREALSHA
jgi:putative ABC transport system permease protein